VYVLGSFSGTADFDPSAAAFNLTSVGPHDAFVLKLDPAGRFVWARRMDGIVLEGGDLAADAAGNVYVAGYFVSTADFGPFILTSAGPYVDAFVTRLDAAGNFVWARQMGGGGIDVSTGVAVDGSGNVYATGRFEATAAFGPFNLTSRGGSTAS
jgi:hypothetical protein